MRRLTVIIAALALVAACADDPAPEVDADLPEDDPTEAEVDEEPEPDDEPTDEAGDDEPRDDGADDADDTGDDDPDGSDGSDGSDGGAAPTPDAEALEDPCADFDEGVDELLLLVAPVDDQQADGELDLVGCAQVPEGTVQYRLLDGDGVTLDEGFTTAECGGPCVGAFRETVSLAPADGEPVVHVQVFWEDLADGEDRDVIERIVVLE